MSLLLKAEAHLCRLCRARLTQHGPYDPQTRTAMCVLHHSHLVFPAHVSPPQSMWCLPLSELMSGHAVSYDVWCSVKGCSGEVTELKCFIALWHWQNRHPACVLSVCVCVRQAQGALFVISAHFISVHLTEYWSQLLPLNLDTSVQEVNAVTLPTAPSTRVQSSQNVR